MIYQENQNGAVSVANNVYTEIAGTAAANCLSVKGMVARSVSDGVYHLLRRESMGKGVKVEFHEDDTISIDLHVMVGAPPPSSALPVSTWRAPILPPVMTRALPTTSTAP